MLFPAFACRLLLAGSLEHWKSSGNVKRGEKISFLLELVNQKGQKGFQYLSYVVHRWDIESGLTMYRP